MKNNYSEKLRDIIEYGREEAGRLQNSYIGPEHLMLGIIRDGENEAYQILVNLHIDPYTIKRLIEQEVKNTVENHYSTTEITVSKATERVLRMSILESRSLNAEETDAEHLLLAIMKDGYGIATRILKESGLSYALILEELEQSKLKLKTMTLPLHTGVRFEYDRLNDISWVVGTDYKVRLTEASSGYQSLVPMCLVTACLSDMVADTAKSDLNVSDKMKLQKEVNEVMANSRLSEDVKNAMLQNISARFKYSGFVNVVEEMEQNLYPLSQKDVLYFLLSQCNKMEANRLMLTTHSPYILNYLSLSTKAHALWQIMPHGSKTLRMRLAEIVPEIACVDIEKLTVYELSEDGTSRRLKHIGDIPTDDNFLNNLLGETNDWFNDLLDLEEQCQV